MLCGEAPVRAAAYQASARLRVWIGDGAAGDTGEYRDVRVMSSLHEAAPEAPFGADLGGPGGGGAPHAPGGAQSGEGWPNEAGGGAWPGGGGPAVGGAAYI